MSEKTTNLFEDPSRTSPRVLPLISEAGNRKQLADWMDSHEFLEYAPFEDDLEEIDFDVCVLDKGALREYRQELARIKAEAEPVIVPYLLLVQEYDETLIEFEQEQLIDAVTPASVDEIASLPLKQKELEWRVRALLRLRNQSIQAHATGRRYRSLYESIRDSILVADTDRRIVDCNQAFTDLFGYSLEDIAGKPTHYVYESKAEFEEMGEAIQDHIGGPQFTKIVSYETKSGEVFPGETNVFYLRDRDGEIRGFIGLIRDVSDRLERERELERSEARYRSLTNDVLDTSNVGVFVLNADFEVAWINEATEEYFGIDREAVKGADKRQLIHDHIKYTLEDSKRFAARVLAIYDDNTSVEEFVCHVLPADERDERWLKHWSQPITSGLYEGGRIEHYTDITDRKLRERELERYKAAVEGSTDMLIAADRNRRVLFANERFKNLIGGTGKEIRGSHLRDIIGKELFEEIEPRFERTLEGEQSQFVREQQTDGGEDRILDVHYYPLQERGDEITGVVASVRDITESERRKRDLREFQQAVEAAGNAIYMTNADGEITYANPAFEDVTGYLPSEAIGKSPRILKSGEMSDGYFEELWETVTSGEIWEEEVVNRRKNGVIYHARQTIAPVTSDSGDIEGFVGIQTDITEQKERQNHLLSLDRILRHNLNNEMNVILGRASMIEEAGSPDVVEHANEITVSGNDLLDQADKEREIVQLLTDPPTPTTVDLADRIRSVKDALHQDYPATAFELDVPDNLEIETIPEIDRAIGELAENAIVHSTEATPEVRISVHVHNERVEIEITDTGPPIPPEELAVVTDTSRIDDLTHSSGMGLWLVKRIVSRADGNLTFDRRDSGGNRVTLALPID